MSPAHSAPQAPAPVPKGCKDTSRVAPAVILEAMLEPEIFRGRESTKLFEEATPQCRGQFCDDREENHSTSQIGWQFLIKLQTGETSEESRMRYWEEIYLCSILCRNFEYEDSTGVTITTLGCDFEADEKEFATDHFYTSEAILANHQKEHQGGTE
ncbi:hypothetical protein CC78DRAFT_540861 [Lojkania enalia]|uniref:Uncharacterized protein n=1 Tax=Lojkania enalia TaxID=147567 RepID=A0A9P4N773_9PLEO|nr:hypothetical protein CC78DRAFT_540861 [Didymosphaeria enalia]